MKLTFLEPLYATPDLCASVYLDTSRDIDDPDKAIALRWRHLRDELTAQGADTATVAALAAEVGRDREISGRHGQAVFASCGHVMLEEELPAPPVRDTAELSPLPDAMPLAVQHAPDIPYVAVVLNRANQRGAAAEPPKLEVDLQAGRWPMNAVAPHPRYRRRALARDWPHDAAEIAGELQDLVDHHGAEAIVVCGDTWARGVLAHSLPKRLSDHLVTAGDDSHAVGANRALLEDELSELFRDAISTWDQVRVETFLAQRAAHKAAVEGMAGVVAALQRGQVSALLLNTAMEFPAPLWAGPEPTHIALSAAELQSFGVSTFEERPASAAVIRALVCTGAELIVIPRDTLPLQDGVGALLRYADPGAR